MFKYLLIYFVFYLGVTQAFVPGPGVATISRRKVVQLYSSIKPVGDESPVDKFIEDIKMRIRIAQESNASGASAKQTIADVLAGEFDVTDVEAKVDEEIKSAPCVMFTWQSSPSCKKAVEAFKTMNANVKIVRLDDPWSEGNPMRAVLGKKVGRTSVPFVFINGVYIGGYDGGLDDDAPGMVNLAFKGKLLSMLSEAGAMDKE